MSSILETDKLTKKFNGFTAVDKVSLKIGKGEIYGLLGPNGAGKTTIIKMLTTILRPTSGKARINGHDILKYQDKVRENIGVVFQDPSTDDELTAMENLVIHGKIYRLRGQKIKERAKELLELVELSEKKDILVGNFSGGMRRRLEIARSFMHIPKVLFLDEPTIGLDPQTRQRIWDYIVKLNKKDKTTIILTTHYMDEADRLCERVGIIDNGKVIADDTPYSLKEQLEGDTITLGLKDPRKLLKILEKNPEISKISVCENGLVLNVKNAENKVPHIVQIADNNGITIGSIDLHKPTLEDVFLHFTGKRIREEGADNFQRKARMMRR